MNKNLKLALEIIKVKGIPYAWGGTTPEVGFDCSGLVQYLFKKIDIELPRTTCDQVKQGVEVKDNFQFGDLVFFGKYNEPHHVGIYLSDNEIIDAPIEGEVIGIRNMYDLREEIIVIRVLA